ncbi:MAG: hypothetical protein AB7T10_04125 [bacterium]
MKTIINIKPSIFILIIILFFLPFAQIRCDSTIISEVKGIEFVTGKELKTEKIDSDAPSKIDPNIYMIFAFATAIIGLILSFSSKTALLLLNGVVSFAGMTMLLLFKNNLETRVVQTEESFGLITVNYQFAYWASLVLFILYGLFSLSLILSKKAAE